MYPSIPYKMVRSRGRRPPPSPSSKGKEREEKIERRPTPSAMWPRRGLWPGKTLYKPDKHLAYAKPPPLVKHHCHAKPPPRLLPQPVQGLDTESPCSVMLSTYLLNMFELIHEILDEFNQLQDSRWKTINAQLNAFRELEIEPPEDFVIADYAPNSIGTNRQLVEAISRTQVLIAQIKSYGGTVEVPWDLKVYFRRVKN